MSRFIRNMRPPRARIKTARQKESQIDGFLAGILSCAWIWNESYEVEEDDLGDMIREAMQFMYDIADGKRDPKLINKTLEDMTGINIMEG